MTTKFVSVARATGAAGDELEPADHEVAARFADA